MTTFTREDFEHAARAAGLIPERYKRGHGLTVYNPSTGTGGHHWNPPGDDGAALRLAVVLGLSVFHDKEASGICVEWDYDRNFNPQGELDFRIVGCEFAAHRAAIFLAAIAIGKAMLAPDTRPTAESTGAAPRVGTPDHQTGHQFHPDEIEGNHDPI